MRNPLAEYYIIENFGNYDPSSGASNLGTLTAEGSSYRLASSFRINQPSIEGTRTFQQYWAVRNNKRTGGTVDMAKFFGAWRNAGLPMGTLDYQVVAIEAYYSSPTGCVVVSALPSSSTALPGPTLSTTPATSTATPT
jgi:endo-1,4-beta-xylanase